MDPTPKPISQLPAHTGSPSGFQVPGVTNDETRRADLGQMINRAVDPKIGNLSDLTTQSKSNLVAAVNEAAANVSNLSQEVSELDEKVENSVELLYRHISTGAFKEKLYISSSNGATNNTTNADYKASSKYYAYEGGDIKCNSVAMEGGQSLVAYYDEDRNYLGCKSTDPTIKDLVISGDEIPEGTKFVRLGTYTSSTICTFIFRGSETKDALDDLQPSFDKWDEAYKLAFGAKYNKTIQGTDTNYFRNGYINTNGTLSTSSVADYQRTDYIEYNGGNIYMYSQYQTNNLPDIGFYDENKTFLGSKIYGRNIADRIITEAEINELGSVKYFVIAFYSNPQLRSYQYAEDPFNNINNRLDSVENITEYIDRIIYSTSDSWNYDVWIKGAYITTNGLVANTPSDLNYQYDPTFYKYDGGDINITEGKMNNSLPYVSYYDSNKEFIGYYSTPTREVAQAKTIAEAEILAAGDVKFVRFACYNAASRHAIFAVRSGISVDEQEIINNVLDIVEPQLDIAKFDFKIQIPDNVYATVGTELYLYNDNVSLSLDDGLNSPKNYHTEWTCSKGKTTARGFRFTPTSSDIGTHSCTCKIFNMNAKLLDTKTFNIVVKNKTLSSTKSILFVGDSTGTNTYNRIVNLFEDSTRFNGSKPTIYNESTGGWHWATYAGEGTTLQRVQVSGVGSLNVGAKYLDANNNNFQILEVNTTDGSGNVLIGKLYEPSLGYNNLTIPSGTLTKRSGTGDTTLNYTGGVNEPGNPFWNASTNSLDIARYRSNRGISEKFDIVVFQLGINSNGNINTEGLIEGYINALYSAFLADNPDTIVVLGFTCTNTNDVSAIGENYGASDNWKTNYWKNEYKFRTLYLNYGQDAAGHPNMRVCGEGLGIDRWYGYPINTRPINSNSTITEDYHTNYVHPTGLGYQQLADLIFATLIGLAQ